MAYNDDIRHDISRIDAQNKIHIGSYKNKQHQNRHRCATTPLSALFHAPRSRSHHLMYLFCCYLHHRMPRGVSNIGVAASERDQASGVASIIIIAWLIGVNGDMVGRPSNVTFISVTSSNQRYLLLCGLFNITTNRTLRRRHRHRETVVT